MKIDLTKAQAILLVAMLGEKIPVSRPEIESEFLKAKNLSQLSRRDMQQESTAVKE